jgi:hypothetical protein
MPVMAHHENGPGTLTDAVVRHSIGTRVPALNSERAKKAIEGDALEGLACQRAAQRERRSTTVAAPNRRTPHACCVMVVVGRRKALLACLLSPL